LLFQKDKALWVLCRIRQKVRKNSLHNLNKSVKKNLREKEEKKACIPLATQVNVFRQQLEECVTHAPSVHETLSGKIQQVFEQRYKSETEAVMP